MKPRSGFLLSALLHVAVIGVFWATASTARQLPNLRVYAVDIVSPPPREQGEPNITPPRTPEPEPEPAEEEPAPEPPEPEPEPEPEPSPPARPTKEPEPEPEPVKPKPVEPKPEPKPAEKPPPDPPDEEKVSTGANPDPSSAGGEDLNVHTEGMAFVDPSYLANIQRQLHRYFRPPADARSDEAEILFRINRDGSVSGIEVLSSSGSIRFRLAAMEAVEQAGLNKAFGPLPEEYPADQLPVSFYFRPAGG
ncbi:MAG TPA: TonB C-terminal domain-containing protein [Longimicrobiaceae bacterium]|nr:TonB C-terminal domain-containing protein [Longimicrobiaceae bacterium]